MRAEQELMGANKDPHRYFQRPEGCSQEVKIWEA